MKRSILMVVCMYSSLKVYEVHWGFWILTFFLQQILDHEI